MEGEPVGVSKLELGLEAMLARERAEKAEALAERRRIEREQALNVTTREGLSASEWLMRTAQAEARAEKAERERDEARENAQHDAQKNVILKGYLAEAREDIKALAEIVRCGLDMDRIERLHPNGLWRPSWQRIRDRKLLDVPDGK